MGFESASYYLKPAHYLFYFKLSSRERQDIVEGRGKYADYVSGSGLDQLKPGDVLWLINLYLGQLYLIGRMAIDFVVDNEEIARELVATGEDDWQEGEWYAITNRYAREQMRIVNLMPYLDQIYLESKTRRSLLVDGQVEMNQIRNITRISDASAHLLDEWWHKARYAPESIDDFLEFSEDDQAYNEGKFIVRTVNQRQRNRQLVKAAKARFRAKEGRLYCEVCGFDFKQFYGLDYIEAHHIVPLSDLEDEQATSVEALKMVCSNCHRMIHSRTPPFTIEELKQLIEENRKREKSS
ncbi:hypothetical protein MASR2M15_08070 [Anaerolineales bacterium]